MSDALSQWLALREEADWNARSGALVQQVCSGLAPGDPVCVLDLGTGRGSNLRYLMDRLPGRQRWLVIDTEARLLDEMLTRTAAWARARGWAVETGQRRCLVRGERFTCDVEARAMDLDRLDDVPFQGQHLVTASALLDLVSEAWLGTLAMRCHAAGAAALFAISYDGRSSCDPAEPEDEVVRALMNEHQGRDKGLGGPAAGPRAHAAAVRIFSEAGYQVEEAPSDWILSPDAQALQRQLIDGWAEAATETAPARAATIADWRQRRLAHVAADRSRLTVGHHDLAAWLPGFVAAGRPTPRP
jgi:hypothetical protein